MPNQDILRLPAEVLYAGEIQALQEAEKEAVPTGWRMSPRSALSFITGGKVGGVNITPKYVGNRRLVEMAIATLLTDRALLLIGEPGTAKSWLSENLAAAIHGDSGKVISRDGRNLRGTGSLYLELRHVVSPGSIRKSPGQKPHLSCHGYNACREMNR